MFLSELRIWVATPVIPDSGSHRSGVGDQLIQQVFTASTTCILAWGMSGFSIRTRRHGSPLAGQLSEADRLIEPETPIYLPLLEIFRELYCLYVLDLFTFGPIYLCTF